MREKPTETQSPSSRTQPKKDGMERREKPCSAKSQWAVVFSRVDISRLCPCERLLLHSDARNHNYDTRREMRVEGGSCGSANPPVDHDRATCDRR